VLPVFAEVTSTIVFNLNQISKAANYELMSVEVWQPGVKQHIARRAGPVSEMLPQHTLALVNHLLSLEPDEDGPDTTRVVSVEDGRFVPDVCSRIVVMFSEPSDGTSRCKIRLSDFRGHPNLLLRPMDDSWTSNREEVERLLISIFSDVCLPTIEILDMLIRPKPGAGVDKIFHMVNAIDKRSEVIRAELAKLRGGIAMAPLKESLLQ